MSREPFGNDIINLYIMIDNNINCYDYLGLLKIIVKPFKGNDLLPLPGESKNIDIDTQIRAPENEYYRVVNSVILEKNDISGIGGFYVRTDEAKCKCRCDKYNEKSGNVILVQLIKKSFWRGGGYYVDSKLEDVQNGYLHNGRHQGYIDIQYDKKGNMRKGGRHYDGIYFDTPGLLPNGWIGKYSNIFRVEAFCRCSDTETFLTAVEFSFSRKDENDVNGSLVLIPQVDDRTSKYPKLK